MESRMARSMTSLLTLLLLANLFASGLASKVTVKWQATTHSSGNPNDAPSEKSSNSNGSSHIYFHQTFSNVKTHNIDDKPEKNLDGTLLEDNDNSGNGNLTSSESRDTFQDQQQPTEATNDSSDTSTSYSTSIDHSDLGNRSNDPPSSSGISKRHAHYPTIPSDVINERDDDDRPANDDDYGDDGGDGSNDDGGDGGEGGSDYDDDEPAESAPDASPAEAGQGDGEVTEEYNDDKAQKIIDEIDGDVYNQEHDNDAWLADDDKDDFDHSASFSVPKIDELDHKGCKTVYKEIKSVPVTSAAPGKLRRKRSATASYMITRECHFGNNNNDDSDKTNHQRVGGRPSSPSNTTTITSATSTPLTTTTGATSTAKTLFGSRLGAVSSSSQIPPPPVVPLAPGTLSSTTKTALPDGSTAVSSFYMSSSDDDMESSDSIHDTLHKSQDLASASRWHRIRSAYLPADENENMIQPDKTRYHNFPYPHFHVYYDQPRLRNRLFARRWKEEYEKAQREQELAKEAEKQQQQQQQQQKKQKPKHSSDDGNDNYDEDDDDKADSDPLAAPPEMNTSVDFNSKEKIQTGGLKSRQRRSRLLDGMYDKFDDNDIDQARLPSSSDGQWTRYYSNSHSYSANPRGRPKNIEYSYYREVNGPSTSTTPTAAPVDDYRNRIAPVAPIDYHRQQQSLNKAEEPDVDYADETRSDKSSTPLNDDDYGDEEGDGGQGGGSHDDGNDDYGGDGSSYGGEQQDSYDDSYDSDRAPSYQGQGSDDGQQQGDDNDDFFAKA